LFCCHCYFAREQYTDQAVDTAVTVAAKEQLCQTPPEGRMRTHWWYDPDQWAFWLWRIATSPPLGWIALAAVTLALTIYGWLTYNQPALAVIGLPIEAAVLNLCTLAAAGTAGRTRQLRSCWLSFAGIILTLSYTPELWGRPIGSDLADLVFFSLLAIGFPASLGSFLLAKVMPHLPWRIDNVIFPLAMVGLAYLQSFVLLPLLFRWRAESY
jgi:hypothetical protein